MKKVDDLILIAVLTLNFQLCLLNARLFLWGGEKKKVFSWAYATDEGFPEESFMFEATHVSPLLCSPKQMLLTIKRYGAAIIPQKVLPTPALLSLYHNSQK